MTYQTRANAMRFHGYQDNEFVFRPPRVIETRETKYFIVQERSLSYRFHLHQHPYVQNLTQRLLQKGTKGLQSADTEYVPGARSLPESIEIAVLAGTGITLPSGARATLPTAVQATAGGVPVALEAGYEIRLAAAAQAAAPDGLMATLVDGMAGTPAAGSLFTPPANSRAVVSNQAKLSLTAVTAVVLHDGSPATIPAGSELRLFGGTLLTLPNGVAVRLVSSKYQPVLFSQFFEAAYTPSERVQRPYPVKDLDFSSSGAYAIYNWELFFHVPMTIAIQLSRNQRFAEAQQWFHYLFDPTDDSDGPTPERFWKVRPFQSTDVLKIEEILVNLATGADVALRDETVRSIEAWKDAPFRPHVVARYRQQAYMIKTVMAYLDNLVAWGDSLFRQDTGEAIDEALMLYVLAANILGPRPLPVPKKGKVRPQTYDNLRKDLEQFGTVMRDMEPDLPFDLMPAPSADTGDNDRLATLRSLGKALYFCVPRNDKLLAYWDTVADRLFKIRNSLNFQGVFRQLALFEPPIDPAMLARATSAGLDVGAIVNGLNQPLPLVRFAFLVQKAAEIVQEVKALGNSLLSAMEKEDGEAMALLRAKHERTVMEMVEHVKYGQLQEAIKSKEGLLGSLALAVQRYKYYERQLGRSADEVEKAIPMLDELDSDALKQMKFAAEEPTMALRDVEVDISQDLGGSGGKIVSLNEALEIKRLNDAQGKQAAAADLDKIGGALALIPSFGAHFQPFGPGGSISFGGSNLAAAFSFASSFDKSDAAKMTHEAVLAAKIGSYGRREQDWAFQSNAAAGEIAQIFKQLRAAQIREAVATMELKNHRTQRDQAAEIELFLNEKGTEKTGKLSNKALYSWMKREVKGLYAQSFQFAFDIAKKAERALQLELGNPQLSYLQFGYLAGKEGLLAGEKLHLDIKRMEMAYHDQNQREYELTKHVSLLQVDPLALIRLRGTGRCSVRLPESLFDMDGPGHYFRRIKTVAVSIPCVSGPYAGVNCTLTLRKSSIRTSPVAGDQYARVGAEDERFSDHFGSLQSIVTSSGQNDSGLFETNLRDERYLPFENSGAISEWQLQLPADPSKSDPTQFDYETISDVILHIRYTAREGGGLLRTGAMAAVRDLLAEAQAAGSVRLFSMRHEFPSEWAKFLNQPAVAGRRFELAINLRAEHYPFWSQSRLGGVTRVDILVRSRATLVPATMNIADMAVDPAPPAAQPKSDTLTKDAALGGLLAGKLTNIALPANPVGEMKLFFEDKVIQDMWLAITWNG